MRGYQRRSGLLGQSVAPAVRARVRLPKGPKRGRKPDEPATNSPAPDGQSPDASPPPGLGGAPARQRRWPKRAAWIAAIVVALLAGVGIGSAASNNADALHAEQQKLNTANQNLAAEKQNLAAARTQVSTLQSEYSAAKTQAQQATTTANAKAAYRARNAALNARSKSLDRQARAIKAAEGELKSSKISADGVYVVGRDIKPGIYHTNGDGGLNDQECYFATLNSSSTSDIADNNNFDGPETVDASGAYALQISGP